MVHPPYLKRLVDVARAGAPDENFARFAAAVGRQLRPAWRMERTTEEVAADILDLWALVRDRPSGEPFVHGAFGKGTAVITTALADQPFIFDTLLKTVREHGFVHEGGFNVVVPIARDAGGRVGRVDEPGLPIESYVRMLVGGVREDDVEPLLGRLRDSLALARLMVQDFAPMTELCERVARRFGRLRGRFPEQADVLDETAAFLGWLIADNWVFMAAVFGDTRLGFARSDRGFPIPEADLAGWGAPLGAFPVRVRKGAVPAPVHRTSHLDEIRVDVPDEAGSGRQPLLLQGLFTYRAVTEQSRQVPLLRRRLAEILRTQDSRPGSHHYKGVSNVFDSLPTEFLLTATTEATVEAIDRVLEAELQHESRTHLVQVPESATTFVIVAMPRDRWSDRLRAAIEKRLVVATGARNCDHGVFLGRFDTMLVHFILTGTGPLAPEAREEILAFVHALTTPWADRVAAALGAHQEEERVEALMARYGAAFEDIYMTMRSAEQTARDIEIIERLGPDRPVISDIFEDELGRANVRIYQAEDLLLSDILPVLDNFGLIVTDQFADPVRPRGGPPRYIDTFRLQGAWGMSHPELMERAGLLCEALDAVLDRRACDDLLNRVLVRAGLTWQAVEAIRALLGYARQIGFRLPIARVQEILLSRPDLVRHVWGLFEARFDPDQHADRADRIDAACRATLDALRTVEEHDQDVTFKTLFDLVNAAVRTNFYRDDRPLPYLSFKFDGGRIPAPPSPRMMFEIYVHHREVEGVHVRGGRIARGGIRWSDRPDYRNEVLGLVATQMVKNVLIVPEGAKGGFFMKMPRGSPAERRKRADHLYEVFIRGLLDLTDNIVDGAVAHPPRVVVHDAADTYLVVAADKGTAHLSDAANALSTSRGYWLGDAFASGGSFGYDHKAVGITARGTWMILRRMFREMGTDPTRAVFTCVGIGDPSGDVFGNGVIEHDTMKLLGAFNHQHVFLDPDPDPRASYEERRRLFFAGMGWDAYDPECLSPGGGVFSRRAKSIPLSPQVKKMLGVLADELPVETVIRLLLRLDVDLLWNGGVGTYVKASGEPHAAANDPANDDLRINANELRSKVVGEGGNLGLTPAARIEYALAGGRINTDAIDNSGGVDMSDHEVNLKILLNPLVRAGRISLPERNRLLEDLSDEVVLAVLADNDTHGRQISLDQHRGLRDPVAFSRAVDWACRRSGLSRRELCLPSEEDLQRRKAARQGLTRPELAVLSGHVKMHVFKELMKADPDGIPGFRDKVRAYFPERVREAWPDEVDAHLLHREIGMTVVTTEVVGESGTLFFPFVTELCGSPVAAVAAAWYHAMAAADGAELRAEIAQADAPPEARTRAWVAVTDAVQRLVILWLSGREGVPDAAGIELIREALARIGRTRGTAHETRIRERLEAHTGRDLPPDLARRVALLGEIVPAREVALVAGEAARLPAAVVRYLAVGEASRLLPAIRALHDRRAEGAWEPVAIAMIAGQYVRLVREAALSVDVGGEVRLGVDRVALRVGRRNLAGLQEIVDQTIGDQHPSLAALIVAEERVRAWLTREFPPSEA